MKKQGEKVERKFKKVEKVRNERRKGREGERGEKEEKKVKDEIVKKIERVKNTMNTSFPSFIFLPSFSLIISLYEKTKKAQRKETLVLIWEFPLAKNLAKTTFWDAFLFFSE
jgi:hypothetical protein